MYVDVTLVMLQWFILVEGQNVQKKYDTGYSLDHRYRPIDKN